MHVCARRSPHIRVAAGGQPQHPHSVFFETASLVAHCCIRRLSGPPLSRHPPVSVSHPLRGVRGPQTLDLRVHPCPSCVTEVAGSERRSLCLLENTQPIESSPLQFPPTFKRFFIQESSLRLPGLPTSAALPRGGCSKGTAQPEGTG